MAAPEKPRRVLAVAARTGRIGCVFLRDGILKDWRMSRSGSLSPRHAGKVLKSWMAQYQPDTVISENPDAATRKSERQRAILNTFMRVAEDASVLNMVVMRQKTHKSVYAMARDQVKRHPALKPKLVTKPPIWKPEPREVVLFEALGMAEQVLKPA